MVDVRSFLLMLLTVVVVLAAIPGICSYLIFLERKLAAYVQDRLGPNRVGPFGLFQPIADGLKFLLKEDVIPEKVDRLLFLVAPALAMGTALFAFAVVPFGSTSSDANEYQFVIAPRVDVGILFVFAVSSLAVYGIILGGWASNNKYSMLGALRSSAQLISYEIPLGLSVLGVVVFAGSLNLERIIQQQAGGIFSWNIWVQPLGFMLFLTGVMAECNRLPFDLPEAEQELVGGYHTEYSALKFGLFFLGEYTHMITTSLLVVVLFWGGWHFPFVAEAATAEAATASVLGWVLKFAVLWFKVLLVILFYMLIRWTIPRFRFDQLMGLAWRVMIPLALANLVGVMVVEEFGWPRWLLLPFSLALLVGAGWLTLRMPASSRPRRVVVQDGRVVGAVR